jgi:hypothetical protein
MKANALNALIHNLENLILKAQLHKRFNMQIIPLEIEKKINFPRPDKIKYQ